MDLDSASSATKGEFSVVSLGERLQ